jgi:hypothetical protein
MAEGQRSQQPMTITTMVVTNRLQSRRKRHRVYLHVQSSGIAVDPMANPREKRDGRQTKSASSKPAHSPKASIPSFGWPAGQSGNLGLRHAFGRTRKQTAAPHTPCRSIKPTRKPLSVTKLNLFSQLVSQLFSKKRHTSLCHTHTEKLQLRKHGSCRSVSPLVAKLTQSRR